MRFLLAAITLAAAGVGFSYLNQQAASSPSAERTALRPLFDWEHDEHKSVAGEPSSTVRDAVKRVQAQSDSILDKFVRDHGLSDQTLDDTLTQVRDAAQASLGQASLSSNNEVAPPTASPSPSETTARDELARANPEKFQTESAPEPKRSNTPGASVHEATIVRNDKRQPAVPDPEIAQVAAKEEAVAKAPTKAVEKKVAPASEWKVIGKTTEGRPLHTRRYGNNGPRTLIVAGLDGEDRIAVRWIDHLADELARRPELYQSSEVLVFRAGNPDGLMKKVSENARGVLINRNFPSRRYRPLPDMSSGAGPATEAETRALLDNLYTFHPRRVIHFTATSARTKISYNRSAREIAGELQRAYSLDIQPLDIEQYPGSLEDFADGTLEAVVLSIQLNVGNDWQQIWSKHQPTILTAVTGRVLDKPDSKQQP
ncbi:MAG: hypothetical protein H7062_23325, partial [Candidatus Saccharimonas sp.]|nr:hypothetical protein [Planctomycetaceae bacterium]